jgi:hypothetical protein
MEGVGDRLGESLARLLSDPQGIERLRRVPFLPRPTVVPRADQLEQEVLRADDLLVLHLTFVGLRLEPSHGSRHLVRAEGPDPALVVARFPTQHLGEEAFWEVLGDYETDSRGIDYSDPSESPTVPVRALAAGPSRVAFAVPEESLPTPYRLADLLLLLSRSPLAVVGPAREPPTDALGEPGETETAIELPFRLLISPPEGSRFPSSPMPKRLAGRAELWHARLAAPGAEGPGELSAPLPPVRAVWTRSPTHPFTGQTPPGFQLPPQGAEEPWRMSLNDYDRAALVHLTANSQWQYNGRRWNPLPVRAERLHLSALGGWLDSAGAWPDPLPPEISVEAWRHRAAMGRDSFVQVIYAGYLFPFGHRASLVKVTERRFHPELNDAAFLRQHLHIVVREPERTYWGLGQAQERPTPSDSKARRMPFERVLIRTLVTPSLLAPDKEVPQGLSADSAFWPTVPGPSGAVEFAFHLQGFDFDGQPVDFAMPLLFVNKSIAVDPPVEPDESDPRYRLDQVTETFAMDARARVPTGGAKVAFAPSEQAGDTSQAAVALTFGAVRQTPDAETNRPRFYPQLAGAEVTLPAVAAVLGKADAVPVHLPDLFANSGIGSGANAAGVYLAIGPGGGAPGSLPLDFSAQGDRSGGLIKPSFEISGLSRAHGVVAGNLETLAKGAFDPKQYFGGALNAKVFGVFSLAALVEPGSARPPSAEALRSGDGLDTPRLVATREGPDRVAIRMQWNPLIQPVMDIFVPGGQRNLRLDATIHVAADGAGSATSEVTCSLVDFELHLIGADPFLILRFDRLEFRSKSGAKPDVECALSPGVGVEFAGPLRFVQSLRELIPQDGFSDPPALATTPDGVEANYGLALPDLALGMFSLQNLRLSAGLSMPFVGRPLAFRFAFCERQEPFTLTVTFIGGGGFFALVIDPNGVQQLEAALEFGACIALNFGVASGSVHVMAGIYFAMGREDTRDVVKLTGYLRVGGQVEVLGLISASIELYLSVMWEVASGKVTGRATLTVEVDISFFSTSVEITCERRFAGSAGDPTLEEVMSPYPDPWTLPPEHAEIDPWEEYCSAYA